MRATPSAISVIVIGPGGSMTTRRIDSGGEGCPAQKGGQIVVGGGQSVALRVGSKVPDLPGVWSRASRSKVEGSFGAGALARACGSSGVPCGLPLPPGGVERVGSAWGLNIIVSGRNWRELVSVRRRILAPDCIRAQ
jgi:hypothetical protein